MKIARDFRKIARDSLKGKWAISVIVGIIAVLLGAVSAEGPELMFNVDTTGSAVSLNFAGKQIFSTLNGFDSGFLAFLAGAFIFLSVFAIILAVIYLILGSFVGVGYAKFNLNLIDGKNADFNCLFEYFSHWKTTTATRFLKGLYVFLWSLLFIIPGIVKTYSYAMTDYILADNPNMTATEAIERSKAMMYGKKWRLFCLQFSFIGWSILSSLTFGIGNLWLTPYIQAATAAFYREVSGTENDFFASAEEVQEN